MEVKTCITLHFLNFGSDISHFVSFTDRFYQFNKQTYETLKRQMILFILIFCHFITSLLDIDYLFYNQRSSGRGQTYLRLFLVILLLIKEDLKGQPRKA